MTTMTLLVLSTDFLELVLEIEFFELSTWGAFGSGTGNHVTPFWTRTLHFIRANEHMHERRSSKTVLTFTQTHWSENRNNKIQKHQQRNVNEIINVQLRWRTDRRSAMANSVCACFFIGSNINHSVIMWSTLHKHVKQHNDFELTLSQTNRTVVTRCKRFVPTKPEQRIGKTNNTNNVHQSPFVNFADKPIVGSKAAAQQQSTRNTKRNESQAHESTYRLVHMWPSGQ